MNSTAKESGFIIEVMKNSRVKYNGACKGEVLYVVHRYENAWGTEKLICINNCGEERIATLKCIRFIDENDTDKLDIDHALSLWVEKTHLPFIFKPTHVSKNSNSHKCRVVGLSDTSWIAKRLVRNDLGQRYENYSLKEYQSAYIPTWYAKKLGLIR